MDKKDKEKDKRLQATYGITLQEWKEMFDKQGGVCWICQVLPKNGILCVDHLHKVKYKRLPAEEKKKYIRALLCFQCNTSFSRIERRKNPRKLLERINAYFSTYMIKGDEV